jgi:Flp pilus assembly protein TadD
MIVLTLLAVATVRRRPYILVGWLWYVIVLLPMIGLLQSGEQATCDHHSYIALIGLFIAVVFTVHGLYARRVGIGWTMLAVVAGLVAVFSLGVYASMTRAQAGSWRDSEALATHALKVTRNNWLAHHTLGGVYLDRGEADSAAHHFRQAIRINPNDDGAHDGLGAISIGQGKFREAEGHYRTACRISPDNPASCYNLGAALAYQGKNREALEAYREGLRRDPKDTAMLLKYALILTRLGRYDDALRELKAALGKEPDNTELQSAYGETLDLRQGAIQAEQQPSP